MLGLEGINLVDRSGLPHHLRDELPFKKEKKMKKVYYEIEVPGGKYCWAIKEGEMCPYFDPGDSSIVDCEDCLMNFSPILKVKKGFLKPEECLNLKMVGG